MKQISTLLVMVCATPFILLSVILRASAGDLKDFYETCNKNKDCVSTECCVLPTDAHHKRCSLKNCTTQAGRLAKTGNFEIVGRGAGKQSTPCVESTVGGRKFKICLDIDLERSWFHAFLWCMQDDGILADIKTDEEFEHLQTIQGDEYQSAWIGATRFKTNKKFTWLTKGRARAPNFLDAMDEEPQGNEASCAFVPNMGFLPQNHGIRRLSCHYELPFICVYP